MTTQSLDADAVTALEKPPEEDPPGKADFDVVIWNWAGDVDPNSLLKILTTEDIGGNSDTFFSNARYDELFVLQGKEPDPAKRKVNTDEMQQIAYDQAPYHVLFYDAALHAYRTDKFGGWQLSPGQGGLPFFAYGVPVYDYLTAPAPAATPSAAPASAAPGGSAAVVTSPGPTISTGGSTDGSAASASINPLLLVGGAALVIVGVLVIVALRRRRTSAEEE
jgi:peptide/nickel transport system substrate-binding protein